MILDKFKLDGKVAIVTGASRGLGETIALGLAEAGADVVGVSRSDMSDLEANVSGLSRLFLGIRADLSTVEPIRPIVDRVLSAFGRLDILVNNAGIVRRRPVLEMSEADWDDVLEVNSKVPFFFSQAVAPVMIRQGGGKIINVASMLSFQGGIRASTYAASKSAISAVTKALANEWAGQGINVNAIAPGYIATEMTAALKSDADRNRTILERLPAGRWGTPEDLKGAVVFLASRASDYMHGHVLCVDGGWLAR